ncbi:MAG: general secretion pathway protein GspF [Deltaproteobacteria bacterium]|nr:general secretion pathway protein GspF [Deltaproteobacteria bacterium]
MGRKTRTDGELGPLYIQDHKRPVTRRQFLAQGFMTGAATVTAPTLLGLLAGRAQAQFAPCTSPVGGAGMIPFIGFDLAGGANIAGSNVLVGGPQGQEDLLSLGGYSKLGLPPDFTPQGSVASVINSEFGLLFHENSALLAGIRARTSVGTRSRVNGVVFCSRSLNDTGNNELNPLYGIAQAGADGGLLTLIGTRSSVSGGNSLSPDYLIDPSLRPTQIRRAADATGLVDAGRMSEFLGEFGAGRVAAAAEAISGHKIDRLETLGEQAIATSMLRSAYADSTQLVQLFSSPDSLNPNLDPIITGQVDSIFSAADLSQSTFEKTAAVMKLVVNQHVGAAMIEIGGYDYHDSTRATGETRDRRAGEAIGACLEYAARSCNDLVIHVISDGSVASDGQIDNSGAGGGKGIWKGDNSSTAASFMLVYSKDEVAGRPLMVNDPTQLSGVRQQVGYFRSDGSVEAAATEMSNKPSALAETAILNYLALHGLDSQFETLLPNWTLGQSAPRDQLIAFQPLRTPTP